MQESSELCPPDTMRVGQELIDPMESKFGLDRPFVFRSVETIASTRFEAIQSAMKDSYHWQRILRPSALLDFDTLVLGSLAYLAALVLARLTGY